MAYVSELGTGQQIYLENQGPQTIVTLVSAAAGQQQSQRNGFETGNWHGPPTLLRTAAGLIVRIDADRGQFFVQVQGSGMGLLTTAPALTGADVLSLRQVADQHAASSSQMEPMEPMKPMEPMEPMKPMQPMQPMEPMRMGDMEMSANPMEMRMGNMHLRMGSPEQQQKPSARRFCPQCGTGVSPEDRFCASCGHRLVPAEG
jgi:NADH pyrophosphatase NudC (nudix superfamily)